MITLVVKFRGEEKKFCFTKRVVTFGPKSSSEVDIPLPLENLETPHAKIVEAGGRYTIHNLAHDPFLTFNDFPFGRRTLTNGTVLRFHDVDVVVHNIDDLVQESIVSTVDKQTANDDLAILMNEVDSLEETSETPEEPKESHPSKKGFWTTISSLGGVLTLIAVAMIFYFGTSARSGEEELKAAQGLSDAAMALFYAKAHNIKPPNRNWSDPNFLEQILSQIIPKSTNSCCNIDSQGNFKDFPYILRIYTNDDASCFLLLAQPKPSFIRWFNPKDSLVVDSSSMELRKVKDIQPLNRIIFNAGEFNAAAMNRIALLVNEGRLIQMEKLDKKGMKAQFSPPEELKIISPGAQNLVYNAPRYYKITEPLLLEALEGKITQEYLQELSQMTKAKNLVFYTTEGMKTAVKAYKNLSGYIDTDRLLVGYFTYDKQTHLPGRTELLVMSRAASTGKYLPESSNPPAITFHSELNRQLNLLVKNRKQALKPLGMKIHELIRANNENPDSNFKDQLVRTLQTYHDTDIEQQRKVSRQLRQLYKYYVLKEKNVTKKQFITGLRTAGLMAYVNKNPSKKIERKPYNPLNQASGRVRSSDGTLKPSSPLN